MLPQKTPVQLSTRSIGDDTLLMDEQTCDVHCLNRLAFLVYTYADGTHSPEQISELINENDCVTCTPDAVDLALEDLAELGLVRASVRLKTSSRKMERRTMLRQLAQIAAVPVVLSLSSRSALAQTGPTFAMSISMSQMMQNMGRR